MRTYERTHPWISFKCDLSKAEAELWILLGEAASKCVELTREPMSPNSARTLDEIYLAKGAAATTSIEGNSLSEEEALKVADGAIDVDPSRQFQKQQVENIIEACNAINSQMAGNLLPDLSSHLISQYNRQILKNLVLRDHVVPGAFRTHSAIAGHVYRAAPAEDCPYLIDCLSEWLNVKDFQMTGEAMTGKDLVYAILRAVVAHIYVLWIHPFSEGNGRTARLVEYHILLSAGVPAPAAHIFSCHYNQTRAEYFRQLDFASKSGGNIVPFISYAVRGFVAGLRELMERITPQRWEMAWRQFVEEQFASQNRLADERQQFLILDLAQQNGWVEIGRIPELSPRLAKAYARMTTKTVQRDLNTLSDLGLIFRSGRKIRALKESAIPYQTFRNPAPHPPAPEDA